MTAGVEPRTVAEEATATRRLPLSVCVMTRHAPSPLLATLARLQPHVAEVVVALDDRSPEAIPRLVGLADEIVLFPHRDPCDAVVPWLHAQCSSRWILNLDDDEVPGADLLQELAGLVASDVTHWWLPRRWLVGDGNVYLDEAPWIPDYQLRLYRNDPAVLRFSDEFHRPVIVSGPAGFARTPLWHLDCVLNPYERRREKALRYERARRGMRIGGIAHNTGLYLPELQPEARTAAVPEAERRLIRRARAAAAPSRDAAGPTVRRATTRELDAYWPGGPYDQTLYEATLQRRDRLDRLPAGAEHTVTLTVANHGNVLWRHGADAAPALFVGTRFYTVDGRLVENGVHTPLPADLPPGRTLEMPVHVRAPARTGTYRLSVDLVHEHVRWFGHALEWEFEVTPTRRVAVIGRGEQLERALDALQLRPETEPVLLEQGASLTDERFGHERAPGLGGYLLAGIDGRLGPRELSWLVLRSARVLRRAGRLRRGHATAPLSHGAEQSLQALASCRRLLVAGPDWQPDAAPTRQLWRLALTAAAARRLGLAVEVSAEAFAPSGTIDGFLTRLLCRV